MGFLHFVESHHPSPATQQLSSSGSFRRNDFTLFQLPPRNASPSLSAVVSFLAPIHGTNCTCIRNRAANPPSSFFVTSSIAPAPSAGVIGNKSRPPGRNASNHTSTGSVAPAFTYKTSHAGSGPSAPDLA